MTGPAGAGKTTTSRSFLRQAQGVWAYVNQDDIRQLIKTGYASADGYEHDWSAETRRQWEVSISICCEITKGYAQSGINSLVDFNASPDEFNTWREYLKEIGYKLVVLLPDKETVLSRNANRDKRSKLTNNKIIQNYEKLAKWQNQGVMVIDNSVGAVSAIIDKLNDLIG